MRSSRATAAHRFCTEAELDGAKEECELEETWGQLERFVGAEPRGMCIDDFVGGGDSTETTAELTDVEILAEVTTERTNEDAAEVVPASADSVLAPDFDRGFSGFGPTAPLLQRYKRHRLSLVERFDYVEEVVYNTPGYPAAVL
ncbi:hypothetical protein HPB48_023112 [Haemaphysalis longicornis]|uniref:Uncharacterized protein n=1 Tax=Haemaphysalis longicornis TaxID=44386 RepID=A0A9J6GT37_HAELO|nr:hypothetical protein HPB48_023112 [Haemaphysalis longicornis]